MTRLAVLALCSWLAVAQDKDAGRLRTGSFRYQTVFEGKDAGESLIRLRRLDSGEFIFTNSVSGEFAQSWEAVATRAFAPVSAKLVFGEGAAAKAAFELHYSSGRVTGFSTARKTHERHDVEAMVSSDTVDQRIDWAAVMSLVDYVPGRRFAFHVYDPETGTTAVTAEAIGGEAIAVPGGTFETWHIVYRMAKAKGAEQYEVWVNRQAPRFLVKELFPNGAVTQLIEALP